MNDLLSSGWIPELFPKDELDGLIGKIRSEAKQAGCNDVPDELFSFFLDKVRKNLHLCLCFSPVGDLFRIRARMFPGVTRITTETAGWDLVHAGSARPVFLLTLSGSSLLHPPVALPPGPPIIIQKLNLKVKSNIEFDRIDIFEGKT